MVEQEEWVDNLQFLGFSSAVTALCLTIGGLVWIRPPQCSVLYKHWPACPQEHCPGTEQGTREWCGYGQPEAEGVTRAVSVMSGSGWGGRACLRCLLHSSHQRPHAPRSPAWPRAPPHPVPLLPWHRPSPRAGPAKHPCCRGWVTSPSCPAQLRHADFC